MAFKIRSQYFDMTIGSQPKCENTLRAQYKGIMSNSFDHLSQSSNSIQEQVFLHSRANLSTRRIKLQQAIFKYVFMMDFAMIYHVIVSKIGGLTQRALHHRHYQSKAIILLIQHFISNLAYALLGVSSLCHHHCCSGG